MNKDLLLFTHEFQQSILSEIQEDRKDLKEDKFTEYMFNFLEEEGVIFGGEIVNYRGLGMKLNGYSVSNDNSSIDLVTSYFTSVAPPSVVSRSDMNTEFKRVVAFINKCFNNAKYFEKADKTIYELAKQINKKREAISKINVFLFTDGIAKKETIKDIVINNIMVSFFIWDIEKVFQCITSGQLREKIQIDFSLFKEKVKCIQMPSNNSTYKAYLAVFPGEILAKIYEEHGARLLERNVRSFLQVRGKVNMSIRNTIKKEPHMFFAYNNGLSTVAQKVSTIKHTEGSLILENIEDFQIVNGGQTTASIYHALKKERLSLKNLYVQVKITEISDVETIDNVVPQISIFANNQNKIDAADFSSNTPFHREVEELSRTTWAPSNGSNQNNTLWYYERAKGQYLVERGKEHTISYKKRFDLEKPKQQKFTKTDLAIYENTWGLFPYLVSRGPQKNFYEFTLLLKKNVVVVDREYFKNLIAKAIIYKRAYKIVTLLNHGGGGYKPNIVSYSLSLIYYWSNNKINLEQVWRDQALSKEFEEIITFVSEVVFKHITNVPLGGNIQEWCKKKECWEELRNSNLSVPDNLKSQLESICNK